MDILGVDVGKHEMHAVLLQQDRSSSKSVANSATGFKQLQSWLRNRKVERVHACLEATGGWSEDLALALYEADYIVILVNPMRIKAFAKSEMLRTKTVRRSRRCAIISGGTGRVKCPEVTEANAVLPSFRSSRASERASSISRWRSRSPKVVPVYSPRRATERLSGSGWRRARIAF